MKKILFVGMPFSIHTIRWINQVNKTENEVYLFPSVKYMDLHKDLDANIVYLSDFYNILNIEELNTSNIRPINKIYGSIFFNNKKINKIFATLMRKIGADKTNRDDLIKIIEFYKPNIIHSFETQNAGYLVDLAIGNLSYKPFWIHTLWGSDIYYFSNFKTHYQKILSMLTNINLLIVEGERDFKLARKMNYSGEIKKIQATGGIDLSSFPTNRLCPSKRKNLILRGTQDLVRRGLVGLRAFERCIDLWKDEYTLHIYSLTDDVLHASEILKNKFPEKIIIHDRLTRIEFVNLLSTCRISVSISRSDGMPNTMLESMSAGAFPIQSHTSCASDIIKNYENGILTSSDDPDEVEEALVKAISDDLLVDRASEINVNIIEEKYNFILINKSINNLYL
jgi:glycosyltransferase involved in cell wall biosynthesis